MVMNRRSPRSGPDRGPSSRVDQRMHLPPRQMRRGACEGSPPPFRYPIRSASSNSRRCFARRLTRIGRSFYPALLHKSAALIDKTEILVVSGHVVNCNCLSGIPEFSPPLDSTNVERRAHSCNSITRDQHKRHETGGGAEWVLGHRGRTEVRAKAQVFSEWMRFGAFRIDRALKQLRSVLLVRRQFLGSRERVPRFCQKPALDEKTTYALSRVSR